MAVKTVCVCVCVCLQGNSKSHRQNVMKICGYVTIKKRLQFAGNPDANPRFCKEILPLRDRQGKL